jgi:hypothetical protein
MYNGGMITMENKGNDKMSNATEYGVVKIGQNISATRKDGRIFNGTILNVRAYDKGTMTTIQVGEKYKNVYLEDCTTWVVWEDTGNEMYWKG